MNMARKTLAFAAVFLMILVLSEDNAVKADDPRCPDRRQEWRCVNICEQPLCLHGDNWKTNVTCINTGTCTSRCACKRGYLLDPATNQCWKRTYCRLRRLQSKYAYIFSRITGTFGFR